MDKNTIQAGVVWLTIVLLLAAALGYLVAPAQMLSVVGVASTPEADFLVSTLAAAFIALVPVAFSVRRRAGTTHEKWVLVGLAVFMIAGSAVDLNAYLGAIVGPPAVPSIIVRTILGVVLFWLAF